MDINISLEQLMRKAKADSDLKARLIATENHKEPVYLFFENELKIARNACISCSWSKVGTSRVFRVLATQEHKTVPVLTRAKLELRN